VGTLPTTAISQAGTPFIGARPGPATFSNGQADDITVWNRELSPNEIRQLYLLGRGGMYQRRRRTLRRVYSVQAEAIKSYLFVNRGQVIGGGTL
jgi:hypothetical protein